MGVLLGRTKSPEKKVPWLQNRACREQSASGVPTVKKRRAAGIEKPVNRE